MWITTPHLFTRPMLRWCWKEPMEDFFFPPMVGTPGIRLKIYPSRDFAIAKWTIRIPAIFTEACRTTELHIPQREILTIGNRYSVVTDFMRRLILQIICTT